MISFRKSLEEPSDRERHHAAVKAFRGSVEAAATYAVEVDPPRAVAFRNHLLALANQLSEIRDPAEYDAVEVSLANRMKEYGLRISSQVSQMRKDLTAATAAMDNFAGSVETGTDDYATVLKKESARLKQAVQGEDVAVIRSDVQQSLSLIEEGYRELKQSTDVVVAQLRDEIHTLHKQLEKAKAPMPRTPSPPIEVMTAASFDERVEERMRSNKNFNVLMLGIPGLPELRVRQPAEIVEKYVQSQLRCLVELVGDQGSVGSWNENVFLVLLDGDRSRLEKLGQRCRAMLSQPSPIATFEETVEIQLAVETEAVERSKGETAATFYVTLGRAAEHVIHKPTKSLPY